MPRKGTSERRAEHLLNDLLDTQGWNRRRPPGGDVLFQNEFRAFPSIATVLASSSKSGRGYGIPEAIIVDRATMEPLAIIEAKARRDQIDAAIEEAEHYGRAFSDGGRAPLAIGLAGSDDDFELRVSKWTGTSWSVVTYDGNPVGWIPNRIDMVAVSAPAHPAELRPTMPSAEVLAERAEELNRLLRESAIKDEFRPAVVAAVMLALWQAGKTGRQIRREPADILIDINRFCEESFRAAGKPDLADSIKVDPANHKLAANAKRIAEIFERLNVAVLTAEHDYLGHLYEAFFR